MGKGKSKSKRVKKYKKEGRDLEKDIMEAKVYQKAKVDQDMSKLKDEDLFIINEVKTEKIKKNREILKADRFVQYNSVRSRAERDKIRDLMKKPDVINKPVRPKRGSKEKLFDIWNTPEEKIGMKKISKNRKRDKNILDNRKDKIKRVVVPSAGQSYNPPKVEHEKLVEEILVEELEDIRQETKLMQELNTDLRPEMETLDEDLAKLKKFCAEREKWRYGEKNKTTGEAEENESDEDGPTKISVNPPVSRDNSLSFKQRRLRKIEKIKKQEKRAEKKARQKAHKERPLGKKQKKQRMKIREYNKEKEKKEKEVWEKKGVVSKPRKLGLYRYKKPKTDFVVEEELPESFRNQKGTEHLIKDQFNSFYRRNLIPVEAPPKDRKIIKGKVSKEHKSNTLKLHLRKENKKGDVALQMAREKLRERKRRTALARGVKAPKKGYQEDDEIIII